MNAKGQTLTVSLDYQIPKDGPEDLEKLKVHISLDQPIGWHQTMVENYRSHHPKIDDELGKP